jgi:hypothetical protein
MDGVLLGLIIADAFFTDDPAKPVTAENKR